jgi:predicted RNase H-like HicB family nuclease
VIEPAEEGGSWAVCIEVPGANGQGDIPAGAKASLLEAVQLILQDRQDDILRSLPSDAVCEPLLVG